MQKPLAASWRQMIHLFILCLLALGLLTSCVEAPSSRSQFSMLDAKGEGAAIINQEWWFLFSIATAIVLLVTILLIAILIRHRQGTQRAGPDPHPTSGNRWIWLGGIAMPVVVLTVAFVFTVGNSWALSAPPGPETTTLTVIGHRWWWEIQYPEQGFTTANQLVIPVGESVNVKLTSADVIHSFWVPQLQYKRDLISGKINLAWLHANSAGSYRGVCAEFCGKQHAHMMFTVLALEPDAYQAWLANESGLAREPQDDLTRAGEAIFLSSTCVYCHTIRGTPAAGTTGPDLTHLASREMIAAGTLENTTANLAGWIMDPQHIKPGSAMPAATLTGDQLQPLLAYLRSLQ